jgi:protein-disulfide isomerase
MRKPLPFWAVIALCAVALAASAVLLVDYVRPAAVFCDADGACGAVKRTIFAYPMGIPTPLVGIGGFLAIGLAQLIPGRPARLAQAILASFGAIVAVGLLLVQASMKSFCPFCTVSDVSALLLFALSVLRAVRGWDPPANRLQIAGGVLGICAAVGVPVLIGMNKKPIVSGLPQVIADELRASPRDRVTVVDFVDFECPFCRMTHEQLGPLLEAHKDQVRVVRKHVPLRMHAHALDAAKAACCAERLGKGPEMAEALFTAPPEQLTPEGCESLAVKYGLDAAGFRDCVKDPAIQARIDADRETFHAAHGHGLPTIFIGETKLEGSQERAVLESTLENALRAL